MSTPPSTTDANGRGPAGRFGPGNRFANGNPHAKRVARLRSALLLAVKPADLRDVAGTLLAAAKGGDVAAAKLLLDRLLGSPSPVEILERLEALERALAAQE